MYIFTDLDRAAAGTEQPRAASDCHISVTQPVKAHEVQLDTRMHTYIRKKQEKYWAETCVCLPRYRRVCLPRTRRMRVAHCVGVDVGRLCEDGRCWHRQAIVRRQLLLLTCHRL